MGSEAEEVSGKTGNEKKSQEAGSPMREEFRRNFYLYAVFNAAGFMLNVVNKLEQTFARSLVECETPVDPTALFTGSARCGDRLFVIGQGQMLSSRGQGMECFFKVVAMVFLAVSADVVGRKPVLVMGLVCLGASTLCFLLAIASPTWLAFTLFALGQGLQGAYPAELLTEIVVNDLSSEKDSDLVVVQQIAFLLALTVKFVTECLGAWLNSSTSTDFGSTWIVVAMANVSLAIFAWAYMRETKPKFEVDRTSNGVLAGVKGELHEYGTLLLTNEMLRLNLVMYAFFAAVLVGNSIDMSFYISYHGIPQTTAALHWFWKFPVGIALFGVAGKVFGSLGLRKGFPTVLMSAPVLDAMFMPFFLTSPKVFMFYQYASLYVIGTQPIINAIDSRWFDQRLTAKFLSMKNLTGYFVGIIAHPVFGAAFDAHATGYFRRMAPYALIFAMKVLNQLMLFGPIWRHPEGLPKVLDRIEKEQAEKAARGEVAEPGNSQSKGSEEKKTD